MFSYNVTDIINIPIINTNINFTLTNNVSNNIFNNTNFIITNNITTIIPNNIINNLPSLSNPLCNLYRTPNDFSLNLAPYNYNIEFPKNQPIELITLKNMYNDISNDIFSSTNGYTHPFEPIIKHQTLKHIQNNIEKYCE